MTDTLAAERQRLRSLSRSDLELLQFDRLRELLSRVLPANPFYASKFANRTQPLAHLDEFKTWPATTKRELCEAAQSDPRILHTFSDAEYTHVHRTSGTMGPPLYVSDTSADWQWWVNTWQFVLDAADIRAGDCALMAFSFGPFIGFWSARDALTNRGVRVIPTGGMSSSARLDCLRAVSATLVCCTPTYALRLAEVAEEQNVDLRSLPVRTLIVAGEPGGSIPEVRARLEEAWAADVVDHAGATEVGPWGYADPARTGLHIIESEFIAEFLPWSGVDGAPSAACYELVLTALGRFGFPCIRYRTGDLVRLDDFAAKDSRETGFQFLPGGVSGRIDEMLTVRGVNVFPSAIESLVRSVEPRGEFRIVSRKGNSLVECRVCVETDESSADQIAELLERGLGLRIPVETVPRGSLSRSETKARRLQWET
ncbi:MAG TPA: phenylacetate--CoA ligase family protein [Pirellulaceae bacterium]